MANPLPEQILYLIIRFTASIPDLPLSIPSPRTTTTLSLKRLIRSHLPPSHASNRLRLIYAGKVLADTAPLSSSLKLSPPPPPSSNPPNDTSQSKSKGKEPIRDLSEPPDPNHPRLYIHCSLSDALSPTELAAEASAALTSDATLARQTTTKSTKGASASTSSGSGSGSSGSGAAARRDSAATTTAPQGFDRLLGAGFTATEIASLRSQFLTNLSFTHTPDDMPSGAALRALEDRWLDTSAHETAAGDPAATMTTTPEGENGWGAGFGVEDGGLDDMLFGYLTGFFWPLAALVWGTREEGVWTRRRQVAVVMGVAVNCVFGFLRWSTT